MGKVVMYASVSGDGFIADKNDDPGPLFDWLTSGEVPLDDAVIQGNRVPLLRYRVHPGESSL